jgi:tyrosyl-tRNA synthetase
MAKTAAGAVWLNADRLPVYDFWQYWRNTEDGDVGRFLRLFTDLPLDEIARLEAPGGPGINEAKKTLATAVTALAHGAEAAAEAAETARRVFEEGTLDDNLPTIEADLAGGVPAYKLFVLAGLASSNGEARRLVAGGGAYLNNAAIENGDRLVTVADLTANGVIKLSKGKKHHALVRSHTS